jgi:hypothetical protein
VPESAAPLALKSPNTDVQPPARVQRQTATIAILGLSPIDQKRYRSARETSMTDMT